MLVFVKQVYHDARSRQCEIYEKKNAPQVSSMHYRVKKKVQVRYRPGVAQRVGRGVALLFHDRGTRRGWLVSSTPRPQFTPVKDPVPIVQEAGWAPGPVWRAENLVPTGIRSRTVHPVVSRYTDWPTRHTMHHRVCIIKEETICITED